MTAKAAENLLIQRAWEAINEMGELIGEPPDGVTYMVPSDFGEFQFDDPCLEYKEEGSSCARPDETAIHCCLASASALLAVTLSLVNRTTHPSPQQRETELKALTELTKRAGRSAYRAGLILVEPDRAEPGPR